MKKFFLILFGDFESEGICKEIAIDVSPIVDSPHLKFNHTSGSIVFHFASEVTKEEIFDYLLVTLMDKCTSMILTENTDNVSVYFPTKVEKHLLDLETESEDVEMKININQLRSPEELERDEEFVALLLEEVKKSVKKPSLDQILDKINKKGFDSLSKFEKDVLDEYSKN